MGFFGNIVSSAVKTIATPIAIVKDVAEVAVGMDGDNTKKLIESAKDDLCDSLDDLSDGNL
jgi:hypothetical protein